MHNTSLFCTQQVVWIHSPEAVWVPVFGGGVAVPGTAPGGGAWCSFPSLPTLLYLLSATQWLLKRLTLISVNNYDANTHTTKIQRNSQHRLTKKKKKNSDPPLTNIGEDTEVTIFAISARYRERVSSSRLVKLLLNGPSKNASCTAVQMLDPRDPSLTPTTSSKEVTAQN